MPLVSEGMNPLCGRYGAEDVPINICLVDVNVVDVTLPRDKAPAFQFSCHKAKWSWFPAVCRVASLGAPNYQLVTREKGSNWRGSSSQILLESELRRSS